MIYICINVQNESQCGLIDDLDIYYTRVGGKIVKIKMHSNMNGSE